jgi:hypothetical protein
MGFFDSYKKTKAELEARGADKIVVIDGERYALNFRRKGFSGHIDTRRASLTRLPAGSTDGGTMSYEEAVEALRGEPGRRTRLDDLEF